MRKKKKKNNKENIGEVSINISKTQLLILDAINTLYYFAKGYMVMEAPCYECTSFFNLIDLFYKSWAFGPVVMLENRGLFRVSREPPEDYDI